MFRSSYDNFSAQIDFLRKYFCQNSYLSSVLEKYVWLKLNSIFNPIDVCTFVEKEQLCFKIPFMHNKYNQQIQKYVTAIVSKFYFNVDLKVIFENKCKIQI